MKSSLLGAFCAAFLALSSNVSAETADKDVKKVKEPAARPCTIRSPSSGHFFDLNSISVQLPDPKDKKKADERTESWHAKGYDYGTNFTMNFCAPVVEELDRVEGVDKALWQNVSAYYTQGKRTYSIGYDCTAFMHALRIYADPWRTGSRILSWYSVAQSSF
jgi:cation-dependent mannose-6-phosphate receptor